MKTKRVLGAAILSLAFAIAGAAQLVDPCAACSVALILDKPAYEIGEPIPLKVRITNTGVQPVQLPKFTRFGGMFPDGVGFEVTDATGRRAPSPAAGSISLLKALGTYFQIPPGGSDTSETFLNYDFGPLQPGRYTLRFTPNRSLLRAESAPSTFEILPTPDSRVRARVAELVRQVSLDPRSLAAHLGFTGHIDAIPPLVELMYRDDDGIAVAASDALRNFRPLDVTKEMLSAIRSRGPSDRLVWLLVVGMKADPGDVVPPLLASLDHAQPQRRRAAVEGLRLVNVPRPDPKLFEPLAARLADPDAQVRHRAVSAVGGYQDAAAFAALKNAVDDTDPIVRVQATIAMGWIAQAAAPGSATREQAVRILRRVSETGEEQIKQQALSWLNKIRP